jgi:hypothetical protein
MSKTQRIGRPESHLTNRGVGVRWGSGLAKSPKPIAIEEKDF